MADRFPPVGGRDKELYALAKREVLEAWKRDQQGRFPRKEFPTYEFFNAYGRLEGDAKQLERMVRG